MTNSTSFLKTAKWSLSRLTLRRLGILLRSFQDILLTGYVPRDMNILKAELLCQHRVKDRLFVLDFLPPNSVGAELGVFTGLFSSVLAKERKISRVTFVDPWWEAFGDHYPDWGAYTDYGHMSTRKAYEVAKRRIGRSTLSSRHIEVGLSYDWLKKQNDRSLDWVYLDHAHDYESTKRELALLDLKVADRGLILGDDWHIDQSHIHHGVYLAVNEFLKNSDFELVLCGEAMQWILRRSPSVVSR
jgi:hypothetical protein